MFTNISNSFSDDKTDSIEPFGVSGVNAIIVLFFCFLLIDVRSICLFHYRQLLVGSLLLLL